MTAGEQTRWFGFRAMDAVAQKETLHLPRLPAHGGSTSRWRPGGYEMLWTPPAANHDKGQVRRCLPARSLSRMAALFHVLVVVPSNLWPYFFNNSSLNTRSTAWNSCGICSTSCFGPPVVVAPTVQVRPATAPKSVTAWTSVWLGPCWWPHPWRPRDGWSDSSRSRGWRRWAARGDGDHGVGGARIWRWYFLRFWKVEMSWTCWFFVLETTSWQSICRSPTKSLHLAVKHIFIPPSGWQQCNPNCVFIRVPHWFSLPILLVL